MEFGAAKRVLQAQIHGCCCQHPQRRGKKIDPQRIPKLRQHSAAKCARRIHAHAGDRRFKRDERRHARAGKQSGEARELLRIRDDEHDGHQDERDDDLAEKRRAGSARTWQRGDVVDGRMGEQLPHNRRDQHNTRYTASELRDDVKQGIPRRDLAQPEKCQRHCRIQVSARLFAPRRVHDADGG